MKDPGCFPFYLTPRNTSRSSLYRLYSSSLPALVPSPPPALAEGAGEQAAWTVLRASPLRGAEPQRPPQQVQEHILVFPTEKTNEKKRNR